MTTTCYYTTCFTLCRANPGHQWMVFSTSTPASPGRLQVSLIPALPAGRLCPRPSAPAPICRQSAAGRASYSLSGSPSLPHSDDTCPSLQRIAALHFSRRRKAPHSWPAFPPAGGTIIPQSAAPSSRNQRHSCLGRHLSESTTHRRLTLQQTQEGAPQLACLSSCGWHHHPAISGIPGTPPIRACARTSWAITTARQRCLLPEPALLAQLFDPYWSNSHDFKRT
jgi:hypothetical protein